MKSTLFPSSLSNQNEERGYNPKVIWPVTLLLVYYFSYFLTGMLVLFMVPDYQLISW